MVRGIKALIEKHYAKYCFKKKNRYSNNVNNLYNCEINFFGLLYLNSMQFGGKRPLVMKISVENFLFEMEIDTGACVSVCHESDYLKYFKHCELLNKNMDLKVLSGDNVVVAGKIIVHVKINQVVHDLDYY